MLAVAPNDSLMIEQKLTEPAEQQAVQASKPQRKVTMKDTEARRKK